MGYYYYSVRSELFIPCQDAPEVERILKMYGTAWLLTKNDEEDIVGLVHSESKSYDAQFLAAIAHLVREGGFVEISGDDDDDRFRLVYRDGKVKKVKAVVLFPEPPEPEE